MLRPDLEYQNMFELFNLPSVNFFLDIPSRTSSSSSETQDISNFDRQLESHFDQLSTCFSSQKDFLEATKQRVSKQKKTFNEIITEKWEKINKEKKLWEESISKAKSLAKLSENLIEINIGGSHSIITTLDTIRKYPDSALAAMFSGRHQLALQNGKAFVDRDAKPFCQMIDFLRTDRTPIFKSPEDQISFLEELDYWGILDKNPIRNIDQSWRHFDPEWCASTLTLENDATIVRKISSSHGIVFGANAMSEVCPYIELNISIAEFSSNGSHIFIGLVDKSKYRLHQLLSTLWRDAPSSWYWDVWSTKLIKTDENGFHNVMTGYGCDCEDTETTIGIYYDEKNKTVSFFKKGISQGVAFTNVPAGLYPSVDVWLESGTVTMLQTKAPKNIKLM